MKYEYKIEYENKKHYEEPDYLNTVGAKGWELIQVDKSSGMMGVDKWY